jgi:hypothetical protein
VNETVSIPLPAYVDRKALEIGRSVVVMLDPEHTPLVVVRVEPALVCVKPDGETITVPAHAVEVLE